LDNLTHTLFGLTLARTPLARAGRGTTVALVLGSNAPDIDIVALAGGSVNYLRWHRGPTHGPIGILGLGAVTAAIVWLGRRLFDRRASDEPNASFPMLVAVSVIGAIFHVLMDLPTAYGTRVLSPFDWHWFSIDLLPIIDIYLLIALAAGLLFGLRSIAAGRRNALLVLTLMAANYGVRGMAHSRALTLVPKLFGPTLPQWCDGADRTGGIPLDVWPRRLAPVLIATSGSRCLVELAAMPTYVSPFQWRIVAQLSNAYELRDVDLLDRRIRSDDGGAAPWRLTLRYPNIWTPAVERAAMTETGRAFLGFSRFPAARSAIDPAGATTVRWADMRYAGGLLALGRQNSTPNPFTATIRIGPSGDVLLETLKPDPPRPR
jgi:membrane-bound metal-dependent hydrolase YbcI (DUF457 family)